MDNPRPEKVAVVEEVRERFESTDAVVITEYRGLDVPTLADLRKSLREAGGEYKVYKNTLVRLAARDLDLEIEELLSGPTALAFTVTRPDGSAGDPVTVAKALRDFGKNHEELVIKGGLLGDERLDADQIMRLASIAPREELLAQFAGLLAAPMQRFAGLLAALPQNLAYALQALIDKGGGPGAPEASPEEAVAPAEEGDEPAEPAQDEAASTEASDSSDAGAEASAEGSEEGDDSGETEPVSTEASDSSDAGSEGSAEGSDEAGSDEPAEGSDEPAGDEPDQDQENQEQ